jgi:sugar phosphate isomerase/epimerase
MPNQQNTSPGVGAIRSRGSVTALEGRLGLNIPYEWWPAAATLKGLEAAGFGWVQVAAPPVGMLADPRHGVRHATALRQALGVTSLNVVVHGPTNLQLGNALHYRAFESLLEYAHNVGARHLVYHALDFARRGVESTEEEHALRRLARSAESLGLTVCLENLCPVYPGRSTVCHDPLSVRDLVRRLDTPAYGMLLDVGHANVVAGYMGVETATLIEPVLETVKLFHVHDNLGARLGGEGGPMIDPLQLDLHLPPGGGTVPWDQIRVALMSHDAPLMMEIHPAHRSAPSGLWEAATSVIGGIATQAVHPALTAPASIAEAESASSDGRRSAPMRGAEAA